MALGGGNFTFQNKVLPGSYINVVSAAAAIAQAQERGYTAMALPLNWGADDKIITITVEDFLKNSRKILGYAYAADEMKGLRDLFRNASVLYLYKLTSGGEKASCDLAEAVCCGTRGNDLKIVVTANVDVSGAYDVSTYLETTLVDVQTVTEMSELVANDFVAFKTDATLVETAGMNLAGGTNGTVDGASHQTFLDKIESFTNTNAIGAVTTDETVKSLYTAFTKRLRDNVGVKFQTVLYKNPSDYEGMVDVKNKVVNIREDESEASLVYWTTGAVASCAVNASNTNKIYDGEYEVEASYTQAELEQAIKAGEFTLHQVGSDIRVLKDINSLVTTTADKGEIFKSNQTIRVVDQIATDIARIFNTKYLGVTPNDADGRTGLWNDIVNHHQKLLRIRAIENFSSKDVAVEQGETKQSVVVTDNITVVNAMEQLYMTVTVS